MAEIAYTSIVIVRAMVDLEALGFCSETLDGHHARTWRAET